VVQEIQRVQRASEDLKANRLNAFGNKMYETHEGLSRLYQVSCPELDFLVLQARQYNVVGARMMGGGFGGCTINIIEKNKTNSFISTAADAYRNQFGHEMNSYVVSIEDGTGLIAEA
jgi:galactokinase